jgi:hypothetical protein
MMRLTHFGAGCEYENVVANGAADVETMRSPDAFVLWDRLPGVAPLNMDGQRLCGFFFLSPFFFFCGCLSATFRGELRRVRFYHFLNFVRPFSSIPRCFVISVQINQVAHASRGPTL